MANQQYIQNHPIPTQPCLPEGPMPTQYYLQQGQMNNTPNHLLGNPNYSQYHVNFSQPPPAYEQAVRNQFEDTKK